MGVGEGQPALAVVLADLVADEDQVAQPADVVGVGGGPARGAAVVGPETEYGQTGVGYFTLGSPLASTDGLAVLSGPHDPAAAE